MPFSQICTGKWRQHAVVGYPLNMCCVINSLPLCMHSCR